MQYISSCLQQLIRVCGQIFVNKLDHIPSFFLSLTHLVLEAMGNVQDVEVGPLRNQSHAEEVAAEYIENHPEYEWTGQWNTTRPGEMSTIEIRERRLDDLVDSPHRPAPPIPNPDNMYQALLPGIVDSAMQSLQHSFTSFLDDRLSSVLSPADGQSSSGHRRLAGSSSLPFDWEILNTTAYDDSDDSDDDDTFPTAPVCPPRTNFVEADLNRSTQSGPTVDAPTCPEVTELVEMFPDITDSIICDVLENNNYDVDKTIENLLQLDPNTTKTSPSHKRRTTDSSESSLPTPTCPVCYEALKPPKRIFQCTNGHLVCEICQRQPQLRGCPTCRQPIMGRATAMEQFLADLQKSAQTKN